MELFVCHPSNGLGDKRSSNASSREKESLHRCRPPIPDRCVKVVVLLSFADGRDESSLAGLPCLVIDEILQYLQVPDLAALSRTSKALRHHAHPRLYRQAHDYCLAKDELEAKKKAYLHYKEYPAIVTLNDLVSPTRLSRLEMTFASSPHYARLSTAHCATKVSSFIKMWSQGYLSSVKGLSLDLWYSTGSRLQSTLVHSPANTSITQLTLVTRGRQEARAVFSVLGLLYRLQALQKLTLDLAPRNELELEPIQVREFIKETNCQQLRHLVTRGTTALVNPLEFLPNLKIYEVLFDNHRVDRDIQMNLYPSMAEGRTWLEDVAVLTSLRNAKVLFRYQRGLIRANMLRSLPGMGPRDHYRQHFQWMWLSEARLTGELALDLWALPGIEGIPLLKMASSLKFPNLAFPNNVPDLAIRLLISNEFGNQAMESLPTYTSSIDVRIDSEKLEHPDIISKTVSKLANLRRLILRFGPVRIVLEQLVDGSPIPVTYCSFPHFFLDIEDRIPGRVVLTDHQGDAHFRHIEVYKFDSTTGWWVAKGDDRDYEDIWHDYTPPVGSPLIKIENMFRAFREKNKKLEQVVGYIYGTNQFSWEVV